MRKLKYAMMCVAVLVATAAQVQAGLILDFSGGLTTFGGGDFTVGFTFSVTTPTAVDGLAWWDEGGDGLNSPHEVGLWTSGGSLLASTTVSNASTVESSTSGFGNWLVADITLLNLGVGDYVIGGVQTNSIGGDLLRLEATASTISGITYGDTVQNTGNGLTLTMPNSSVSSRNDGAWGPNLRTASAVPEPTSMALFGLGTLGMGVIARRRKKQQLTA